MRQIVVNPAAGSPVAIRYAEDRMFPTLDKIHEMRTVVYSQMPPTPQGSLGEFKR